MQFIYSLFAFVMMTLSFTVQADKYLDVFARLPAIENLTISPDGQRIAYLQDVNGQYVVVIKKLSDDSSKSTNFLLEKGHIRSISWANNDRLLFHVTMPFYAKGNQETFTMHRVGLLNIHDKEVSWPFKDRLFDYNVGSPKLVNRLVNDDDHILMSYYFTAVSGATYQALYKVNIEEASIDKVVSSVKAFNWQTDQDGNILYYKEYDPKSDSTLSKFRYKADLEYVTLSHNVDGKEEYWKGTISAVDQDRQFIYYIDHEDDDLISVYQAQVEGNLIVNKQKITSNGKHDVTGVVKAGFTQLYGFYTTENIDKYDFQFDRDLAGVYADLVATLPGASIDMTSYSSDRQRFIVKASGNDYPEQYFFYDRNKGIFEMIAEGFPNARRLGLGKVQALTYQASDEVDIPAYLTLPQSASGKKPALIVIPHGGPESRDDMGFNWMRQFFASQGFAVFQPNFRGSSGYGKKYAESGYGQWGQLMQQDIDDGVNYLIKQGYVDKNRICILGASYGGYAAMMGATQRPDLYKCAVSFGGVSNLDDIFYHAGEQLQSTEYWRESIGERKNIDELKKISPMFLVSADTSPMLLVHGGKDTVVTPMQSRRMYKALKEAGFRTSEHLTIDDADHWFSSGETRRIFLKKARAFINKHIEAD